MPIDSRDPRKRVTEIFKALPLIKLSVDDVQKFTFPKLTSKSDEMSASEAEPDYSAKGKRRRRKRPKAQKNSDLGPIERLRNAVEEASEKLRFGETKNRLWADLILFSDDRISRRRPLEKRTSDAVLWEKEEPINSSSTVFEDWFVNHFLEIIAQGGGQLHTQALTGAPGSGKSTLMKYAMSYYASELEHRNVVLSRFEFLKFLADWYPAGHDITQALENYISFIHARDLILSHFFLFKNGDTFELRPDFKDSAKLRTEIAVLSNEMHLKGQTFGFATDRERLKFLLEEAVSKAQQTNNALMGFLRLLDTNERTLLTSGLWQEKTVVTMFDGLDALNVEDAFQETREWKAIEFIVAGRARFCRPTKFFDKGISVKADSLTIMRKNTLALLKSRLRGDRVRLGINKVHKVGNIDGMTSVVSIAARASRFIGDAEGLTDKERSNLIGNIVTLVQRTLLAISRGQGARLSSEQVYGVFDGNLREMFGFVSRVIHHSLNEMLSTDLLDKDVIFGDTASLAAKSVEVGNDYILSKSYHIVELFLYDGIRFENALRSVGNRSREFPGGAQGPTVLQNENFNGWLDNIFSYHFVGPADGLDAHPLIEKIRVLQCLRDGPKTGDELREDILKRFGYEPPVFARLLLFMLKSDLISADIIADEDDYDFKYCCTHRAILGLDALVENLAYIENVFHRIRFPQGLVSHIADTAKGETGSEEWAASALNNAFILLVYLRHVELNPAGDVVPDEADQVFHRIYQGVYRSVNRMLLVDDEGNLYSPPKEDEDVPDFRARQAAATRIAAAAHKQLSMTYAKWRAKSLVPENQIINLLELDQ